MEAPFESGADRDVVGKAHGAGRAYYLIVRVDWMCRGIRFSIHECRRNFQDFLSHVEWVLEANPTR